MVSENDKILYCLELILERLTIKSQEVNWKNIGIDIDKKWIKIGTTKRPNI